MPVCARAVVQPDGSFLLGLDPAVTDLTTCAYVVETGSASGWRELGNMSIGDAQVIGAYVGVVWAVAWGFRVIAKSLAISSESESS